MEDTVVDFITDRVWVDAAIKRANEQIKEKAQKEGYVLYSDAIKLIKTELGLEVSEADDRLMDPDGWQDMLQIYVR